MNRSYSSQSGQGSIETGLVLVLILIPLIMNFVEPSLMIREKQILSQNVAQIANAIPRDCTGLNGAQANACLDAILTTFNTATQRSIANFAADGTVAASIFTWDPVNGVPVLVSARTAGGAATSQYTVANIDANLLSNVGALYIGEIYLNHYRLLPIPNPLDWLAGITFPQVLYETAIY